MNENDTIEQIRPFYKPASVAVIGASRTPGKGGFNIIENLQRLGYAGAVYPVNPTAPEVLGLTAYPDIESVPEAPELALVIIPPGSVIPVVEACIRKGVKAIIIETAGFGETNEEGAHREREIARMAREAGIRVMGPNSVGTIDTAHNFNSSLGRLNELFLPQGELRRGNAAFIGQTGLFTGVFLPLLNKEIGISTVACLGNKCDVDESDMLAYVGADEATSFIGMYLESIKDGRRFLRLCEDIVPRKPVVAIKSATTEHGARMSASHTGAIAGEDHVYEAAFRQAGILRAESFEELWDITRAFTYAPLPAGNRVAIINLAGSGCVLAVDTCIRQGLRIAELSPATKESLAQLYPDWWTVSSPVDIWTAIEVNGFDKVYPTVTRTVLADENVDAVVVISAAIDWLPGQDFPALFADVCRERPDKPVLVANPLGDREVQTRLQRGFLAAGIPAYDSSNAAINALAAMHRYRAARDARRT